MCHISVAALFETDPYHGSVSCGSVLYILFFVKNQILIIGLSAFVRLFVFHHRDPHCETDADGTIAACAYQNIHPFVPKKENRVRTKLSRLATISWNVSAVHENRQWRFCYQTDVECRLYVLGCLCLISSFWLRWLYPKARVGAYAMYENLLQCRHIPCKECRHDTPPPA